MTTRSVAACLPHATTLPDDSLLRTMDRIWEEFITTPKENVWKKNWLQQVYNGLRRKYEDRKLA